MQLRQPRSRKRASITSLIDVIFLLLLFFMLASTFTKFSEVEVMSASGQGTITATDHTVFRVLVEPTRLLLDGEVTGEADLDRRLRSSSAASPVQIVLSVGPETTTQRMVDILMRLSRIEHADIKIAEPL